MTFPVVPVPATVTALDGALLIGSGTVVAAASKDLAEVAAVFVEDVRADSDPRRYIEVSVHCDS